MNTYNKTETDSDQKKNSGYQWGGMGGGTR